MALDSLMGVGLRPLPGLAPPLVFIERHPDHETDHADAHCDAQEPNGKYGEYGFNHFSSPVRAKPLPRRRQFVLCASQIAVPTVL